MKPLFWVGLVVLVLGVASLFMTVPKKETEGIKVGDAKVGVEVEHHRRVSPVISAVLILGGAGLMIAGRAAART